MKRGFTLVEMITVIILIVLLSLIAIPPIMNQISNSKDKVSNVTSDLIFTAAEMYVNDNKEKYPLENGREYCIALYELVNTGLLEEPIYDYTTDIELSLDYFVKIKVNNYNEFELEDMYTKTCSIN